MLAATAAAHAQETKLAGMKTENVSYEKNGDYMAVTMDVLTSDINIKHDRAFVITPFVTKEDSTVTLQSVGLYSYNRWHYYKRNGETMITGSDETSYMKKETPEVVSYEAVFPYQPWMDGSKLHIKVREYGCCNRIINEDSAYLTGYEGPYIPEFIYISPVAEIEKTRYLSGTAYIGFPVNETVIYPNFQNNVAELGKIRSTIDSVRNDSDITIKSLAIKGFASPESPYDNNTRLAKGRTEALRKYVNNLYHFPESIITTAYEPENWEGLRAYVEQSNITNKQKILDIIDCGREPDNKEWYLKSTYPTEYRFLLQNCYPALRRSDYKVEYVIRSFTDPKDIIRIMRTAPQKLSLQEFYVGAQSLELGSPVFCELFGIAVLMYPDDKIANLNAANAAMTEGNMRNAERYLQKAGDSDEAIYARGVFATLNGDYEKAESLFKVVQNRIPQAADALEQIKKLKK